MQGAGVFEACGDLLAQFFGVTPEAFRLLAESLQFSDPEILIGGSHGPSVKRVRGAVTDKRKLDCTIRVRSSRALAVHYLRRELGRLGKIDEIDRRRIRFGEVLQVE